MVCTACSEVSDVWGEEDSGNVSVVGGEFADRDEGGYVAVLDHAPDEYSALKYVLAVVSQSRGP